MPLGRILAALLPFICAPAMAQQPALPEPAIAARASGRFPQPVRVGDLLRRQVLRPVEQQNVLGRVERVVRRPDGAVLVIVSLGGVLGLGARPVAVPLEAIALLGEYLALMELAPEQLRALATFDSIDAAPVPPNETVRVGLVRPFH